MSHSDQSDPASVRRRAISRRLIKAALISLVAFGVWFGFWRYHLKRYQVMQEGICIRTGQPTQFGFGYLTHVDGVKTFVTCRPDDPVLYAGLFDPGEPDGPRESEQVAALDARQVRWPMGAEACWPWVTPWQFEDFFKLFDDPANLPVAIHCVGGRHRTGTLAALFRIEYDRWPASRAIREMLSFDFGENVPIQDLNLRTYLPRPLPSEDEWQALVQEFSPLLDGRTPATYGELVHRLRDKSSRVPISRALNQYLKLKRPFALPLAQRLIDEPDHPSAAAAARSAADCLARVDASHVDWAASAALVADFGTPRQQAGLLAILQDEPRTGDPSPRYRAVVAGVTNRYTPNRVGYLRPLLDDPRPRPEPDARAYRYCDTAVARLSAIIDVNLWAAKADWDNARALAQEWFEAHPREARLSQLIPAPRNEDLRTAGAPDYDGRRD